MNIILEKKTKELEESRKRLVDIGQKFHFFSDDGELTVFNDMLSNDPSDVGAYMFKKIAKNASMDEIQEFLIAIDDFCAIKSEVDRIKNI